MQKQEGTLSNKYILTLFNKYTTNCSPLNLMNFLQQNGLVKLLEIDEFCAYIKQHAEDVQQFQKFIGKFMKDHNKQNLNSSFYLHYPVIKNQSKQFTRKKISRFISEYNSQKKIDVESQFIDLEKQKISKDIKRQQKKDKFIIPKFLKMDNKTYVTFLLQLDLSEEFSQQLKEVINVIASQIRFGDILVKTYKQFLLDFLDFYHIKEGQCENQLSDNSQQLIEQLQQYLNYFKSNTDSTKKIKIKQKRANSLLKCWSVIYKNSQLKRQQIQSQIAEQVKDILLQGLKAIFLTFSINVQKYGNYFSDSIFININQKKELSFTQFRQGPLKPYIALTIYHELTHWLLRKNRFCTLSGPSGSFIINQSSSLGKVIMDFIVSSYKQSVPQYLRFSKLQMSLSQFSTNQLRNSILELTKRSQQILEEYKDIFNILKQFDSQKLKEKLVNFSEAMQVFNTIQIKKYKNDWSSIYDYIKQLQQAQGQNDSEILDIWQQRKYQLFFSFFATKDFGLSWLKVLQQDQEKYIQYRKKLLSTKINRYFIKQNLFISSVINQQIIKPKKISNTTQIENIFHLCSHFLLEPQKFQNETLKIFSQLKPIQSKTKKLILEVKDCFSEYQEWFGSLKISKFLKKLIKDKFPSFIPNFLMLERIFQICQSYQVLKNIVSYSDILQVACQIPYFFTAQRSRQVLESGYEVQRRLFPSQGKKIYSKDYYLIKNIQNQVFRRRVGQEPDLIMGKNSSIVVNRQQRSKDVGIEREGFCQNYLKSEQKFEQINNKRKKYEVK